MARFRRLDEEAERQTTARAESSLDVASRVAEQLVGSFDSPRQREDDRRERERAQAEAEREAAELERAERQAAAERKRQLADEIDAELAELARSQMLARRRDALRREADRLDEEDR
ncbi:MAG: hypothetical protein AAF567_19055 [Actinomycetota bacterium]